MNRHSAQRKTTNMEIPLAVIFVMFVAVVSKTSQLVLRNDADDEKVILMGTSFNNSMLKMIGHAFVNVVETVVHQLCHKTPCSPWDDWNVCTADGTHMFGYQTRVRKCWYNRTDACAQDGPVTIESASKLCEGGLTIQTE